MPAGVLFDAHEETFRPVAWIDGAASSLPIAPGRTLGVTSVPAMFPGVKITTVETGAGAQGVWFLSSGVPVAAEESEPASADPLAIDATIVLTGDRVVTVQRLTGSISP
jgi:hypothetical protein